MLQPLVIAPCQARCRWRATGGTRGPEQLFACRGCGSEWVPSEPWTPIDASGAVPVQVARARSGRGRG